MAGRGRGRGRGGGSMTFDIGSLGFGRGEGMPAAILQPPPLFPQLEFKPTPLSNTEVDEYLLALKQEIRGAMRDSPYYIKKSITKKDISRYSDKYKGVQNSDVQYTPVNSWLFPKELLQAKKRRTKVTAGIKPRIAQRKLQKIDVPNLDNSESMKVFEKIIEEKIVEDDEDVKEGEEVEEEEYFEEEEEEENDYLVNYYDEGEDEVGMGDEDDGGDDGPVY